MIRKPKRSGFDARTSQFLDVIRRLREDKKGMIGGILMLSVFFGATFAPLISPYDPNELHAKDPLTPPNPKYVLGTDQLGRDILSRILWGARISIIVGIVSVSIALAFGVSVGAIAGYYRGVVDEVIMRVVDGLQSIPTIFLALLIITILGPGIENLMIAVGIVFTPQFARITRGSVLSIREKDYVLAAQAIGYPDLAILLREVLPNSFAPLIIQATISYSIAILIEAALSFLGLGIQPPTASWGSILSEARAYITDHPWWSIFPGLAIILTVLALNLLGDALRDVLDPRLRLG